MAFVVPVSSVNSNEMSLTSVKSKQEIDNVVDQSKTTDSSTVTAQSDSSGSDAELNMKDNTILMNDNNFLKWLQEILCISFLKI